MSLPKEVPNTLATILDNPVMQAVQNRAIWAADELAEAVLDYWNYDLFSKNPGVAYTADGLKVTTLDLATFFYALVQRNAVINLPTYKAQGPSRIKENETILSKDNRHGQCIGLTSNQKVFNFGTRMIDQNVMVTNQEDGSQTTGAFRTYLLTGYNGDLFEGWNKINFVPSAEENKFLNDKDLWDGSSVRFDRFVSPEKWISFYGQYYFIAKALIDRLVEERKVLKGLKQEMMDAGIEFPASSDMVVSDDSDWPKSSEGDYESKKVWCFEAELDLPENDSQYPRPEFTSENLQAAYDREKKMSGYIEKLRFLTRSIELAFANKHPHDKVNNGEFVYPSWIKNFGWEQGFKEPGGRKEWNRLKIMQPSVGERSVGIRFRWLEKSHKIKLEM